MVVQYNNMILSTLVKAADSLNKSSWKFNKVQKNRTGETFNGSYSENTQSGYAGAFYDSPDDFLTVFVGHDQKYGYCISFCSRNDMKLNSVIEFLKYTYIGNYNSFDKHYWYTLIIDVISISSNDSIKIRNDILIYPEANQTETKPKMDDVVTEIIKKFQE